MLYIAFTPFRVLLALFYIGLKIERMLSRSCVRHYLPFRQVGIPQPDPQLKWQLPQQQTIHPTKRKLHKLQTFLLHMCSYGGFHPAYKLLYFEQGALNAGLSVGVVVLNAIEELAEAPIAICFDIQQLQEINPNPRKREMIII